MVGEWGIFDQGGGELLTASSVFGIEYRKEFKISDYQQEKGAFESYNKVELPYGAKVVFLVGGSEGERAGFLNQVRTTLPLLDLVTVATPEIQYPSANLTGYSYRRTSRNGVTLIQVEVDCEEVRIVQTGQLSNTASPNGAATTNGGTVQTQDTQTVAPAVSGFSPPEISGSAQFSPGVSATAAVESPQINPSYYATADVPQVPNTYSDLTSTQQQTVLSEGRNLGTDAAQVIVPIPPRPNGGDFIEPPAAPAGAGDAFAYFGPAR